MIFLTERLSTGSMQQQELKYLLKNPEKISSEQLIFLQQLAVTYPAFTALQVCLWKVYKLNQHILLEAQQRKVLAIAPEELFLWEAIAPIKVFEDLAGSSTNFQEEAIETIQNSETPIEVAQDFTIIEPADIHFDDTDSQSIPQDETAILYVDDFTASVSLQNENIDSFERIEEEAGQEKDNSNENSIKTTLNPDFQTPINSNGIEVEPENVHSSTLENPLSQEETPEETNSSEIVQPLLEINESDLLNQDEKNEISIETPEVNIALPSITGESNLITEKASDTPYFHATQSDSSHSTIGNSPEMTFSQWMVWIQERKTNTIDESDNLIKDTPEEQLEKPASFSDDPLEKLYLEHMSAEYLKLEEPTGTSLQQEALERVKKAENGEKNSFNLQQIAKDSLDETLIPVSETLAKIYESQEEWRRALTVYEKLLLQFPDKTLLFAAKIQELKTKI